MKVINFLTLTLLLFTSILNANAQQVSEEELYDLSLEELMDISIVSASKKKESLFEAPLASYTISKEDIFKAGATSIPEALRLCPDIIVRESTNGVYDVHIRGFDNVPRFTDGAFQVNQLTLVMIDDRPVFNHNMGVVYWEALPIGLHDVERIEIVRGPSAPLFGPNAVTGVINIITKDIEEQGAYTNATVQAGNFGTVTGGATVGFKPSDKISIGVSGNFQSRDRYASEYYEYLGEEYKDKSELIDRLGQPLSEGLLDDHEMALEKYGVNVLLDYNPKEKIHVGIDAGLQDAEIQKYYFGNDYTPFSFSTYENQYVNISTTVHGLKTRLSYTQGSDNMNNFQRIVSFKYKYDVSEIFVDYTWDVSEKLSIQPGFNYFYARYEGNEGEGQIPLLPGEESIATTAASVRFDYKPLDKLRLIAALRADKFSQPDDVYFAYQFASTYKLNEHNIIRGSVSRSNSSAFIGPTFLNVNFPFPIPDTDQTGIFQYQGNPDLELFTLDAFELGYRSKVGDNVEVNLDLYYQIGKNFYGVVEYPVPDEYFQFASSVLNIENLPNEAHQYGASLSANWVVNAAWQAKPYLTLQTTQGKNIASGLYTEEANPVLNVENTDDEEHQSTPNVYGGLFLNYKAGKFNVNLNPYYMSAYTIYNQDFLLSSSDVGEIDGALLLNAKVSYQLFDQLNVFVNARNLTGTGTHQMYGTDAISTLVLGGLKFDL